MKKWIFFAVWFVTVVAIHYSTKGQSRFWGELTATGLFTVAYFLKYVPNDDNGYDDWSRF